PPGNTGEWQTVSILQGRDSDKNLDEALQDVVGVRAGLGSCQDPLRRPVAMVSPVAAQPSVPPMSLVQRPDSIASTAAASIAAAAGPAPRCSSIIWAVAMAGSRLAV